MSTLYIHQRKEWPALRWDAEALAALLAATRHAQGRLLGRMEGIGFRLRGEADLAVMTDEVLESSQKGGVDITPWLAWFVECLGRALARAEATLASVLRKAGLWQQIGAAPVNER